MRSRNCCYRQLIRRARSIGTAQYQDRSNGSDCNASLFRYRNTVLETEPAVRLFGQCQEHWPLFLHNLKHIPELDTAQPTPPSRKPHGLLSSISGNTARRWSRQAHKEKIAGSPSVIHVERRHPIAPARGHPAFDEGTCGGGLITRIGVSLV